MSALITNQREQIRELIDSAESIGIVISENQNIDTAAAALGLYLVLVSQGKNVQVISKKEPTVEISNLVGVDRIRKAFEGKTSLLTISVPYREGEIEKVSYNIEDTRLNVNLFAETTGITFSEKDIEYIRKGSTPSLIITLGVLDESELLGMVDLKNVKSIHIDRNPLNALEGDVLIIDPSFSSLSEIVTKLIIELNLGYDVDSFQNLLDGITWATRNFTSQTTSPHAFEAAGFLLQNGAKRKERRPFDQNQFARQGRRDRPGRPFDSFDQAPAFAKATAGEQGKPNWQRPSPNPSVKQQPEVSNQDTFSQR